MSRFFPPPAASSIVYSNNIQSTEQNYTDAPQSSYVAAPLAQQQQQHYQPQLVFFTREPTTSSPPLVRRRCCSCLPEGFAFTPLALIFSLIAFCLNTVAFSNNGDIFWGGWMGAEDPKSTSGFGENTYYRITLSHQNTCQVSDFCDDFFADSSRPIATLAGSSQLVNMVFPIQSTFGVAALLSLITIVCFIYATSACCRRSSSSAMSQYDVTSSSSKRWRKIAFINTIIHSVTACAIFYMIFQYRNATVPFIAAQKIVSFTFQSGFECAYIGGWFHICGALLWLMSGFRSALLAKKRESTATPPPSSPLANGNTTYYSPAQVQVIFDTPTHIQQQESHSEPLMASSSNKL